MNKCEQFIQILNLQFKKLSGNSTCKHVHGEHLVLREHVSKD